MCLLKEASGLEGSKDKETAQRRRGGCWAVLEQRAAVRAIFSNGYLIVVDIATQLIRWTVDSVRADARASRTGVD
jgi:hypothetical protein